MRIHPVITAEALALAEESFQELFVDTLKNVPRIVGESNGDYGIYDDDDNYIATFTSREDADLFIEAWGRRELRRELEKAT